MIQIRLFLATALAVLVSAQGAFAQDAPPMPTEFEGDGPTEVLDIPPADAGTNQPSFPAYEEPQQTMSGSTGPELLDPNAAGYDLWDSLPPVTESTGTWLDRGYWYSQIEAVAMTRQWSRGNLNIAATNLVVVGNTVLNGNQTFPTLTPNQFDVPTIDSGRLRLDRNSPGREGSARFTLGRFLARDCDNRDHSTEVTFFGGGEFGHNCSLFADPNNPNTLQVPSAFDLNSTRSFDGANSMFVQYDSRFNSFEWNYRVSTRLDRDRMVMLPNGHWVRRAKPGLTYQGIAGVRYLDLTENLLWTADDIVNGLIAPNDVNGVYDIRTSNDLFGMQGGGGITYQAARFNIGGLLKMGILANDAKARSGLVYSNVTDGATVDDVGFSNSNRSDTLSFLMEFSLVGRYYLHPSITLRTGYHALYFTEVALAPHQIDFAEDNAKVASSGDPFYHGISAGLDFTW